MALRELIHRTTPVQKAETVLRALNLLALEAASVLQAEATVRCAAVSNAPLVSNVTLVLVTFPQPFHATHAAKSGGLSHTSALPMVVMEGVG